MDKTQRMDNNNMQENAQTQMKEMFFFLGNERNHKKRKKILFLPWCNLYKKNIFNIELSVVDNQARFVYLIMRDIFNLKINGSFGAANYYAIFFPFRRVCGNFALIHN